MVWQESELGTVTGGELHSSFRFRSFSSPSLLPVTACDMLRRYVQRLGLESAKLIREIQGKGKTPREVLGRIDYGGTITTLAWVCEILGFLSEYLV